jgi:glycosyltransferase involved in cell wall biosynthesis
MYQLIYFVKLVRFSNTNSYVEEQLRRQFPEAIVEVFDVKRAFQRPSWALLRALTRAILCLAADCARGRFWKGPFSVAVRDRVLSMPVMYAAMSRAARRTLERERHRLWFTVQTQSLWNSALEGVPHFVYTDSTVLANLYFKRKDFRYLRSAAWLERERSIYADATRVFVMSEHVGRSLTELYGIDASKVKRIGVGANLKNPPAHPQPAPRENKTILFVGLDWERKGGPELIAAFHRLRERHGDARLLIVGASPPLKMARCEIIGRVAPEKVPEYYAQAAIFCLPTRIEPFGIAFIEAMMHALAVAAPRHGAMLDYIEEKDTGVLYEPGDPEDIARALTWLLDHPAERQAIAARGFQAVRSLYTWDAVGRRLRTEILAALAPAGARSLGTLGSRPRLLSDREPAR